MDRLLLAMHEAIYLGLATTSYSRNKVLMATFGRVLTPGFQAAPSQE